MDDADDKGVDIPEKTDTQIWHFIPSVELRGSRTEQLRKLDTLIVYLERLRGTLAGNTTIERGKYESPRLYASERAWSWFAAGALASAAFALLLVAKGCA